jgi:tetratricopeptide (TPR) repeat protein
LHEFLRWFQQPRLPDDPINNPLSTADTPYRIAGGLRVYLSGLLQVVFPWRLSGDYSYPQEPIPDRIVFPASVLGALLLVVPPIAGFLGWLRALFVERRSAAEPGETRSRASDKWRFWLLLAIALVWVPLAYFPHSNILVVLPTVRAERFWYLPVIGSSLLLGAVFGRLITGASGQRSKLWMAAFVTLFFAFQATKARAHALDYTNDLVFWRSTARAAPNSAKAHLNYSVMVGARSRLQERLTLNRRALELAPNWAMAHIYYGDTLCRMRRPDDAWPHYKRGFKLAANDSNLIALALQCLWDHKGLTEARKQELLDLAEAHEGSWLAYFANEIVANGEQHGGIEKRYRPRGYNEGPKQR